MPVCGKWFGPWFIFPIIGLVLAVAALFLEQFEQMRRNVA